MSANVGESYNEQILQATIDGEPYVNENPYPSRIEVLLMELKEAIEQGSGAVIDTTVNGTSENAVQNKAIYNYVNSSVATNTANFIGTFNSVAELEAYSGTVTNNDYAFVISTDSDGNTVYNRYKYNGETEAWAFEYALNNSSFTAAQWAAINSGLTSSDKTTINGLGAASTKGFDATPTSGSTNNAVSSDGVYQALTPSIKTAHVQPGITTTRNYVAIMGHICFVSFAFTCSENITSSKLCFYLPNGFRSNTAFTSYLNAQDSDWVSHFGYITALDGAVYVRATTSAPIAAGTTIMMSGVVIIP